MGIHSAPAAACPEYWTGPAAEPPGAPPAHASPPPRTASTPHPAPRCPSPGPHRPGAQPCSWAGTPTLLSQAPPASQPVPTPLVCGGLAHSACAFSVPSARKALPATSPPAPMSSQPLGPVQMAPPPGSPLRSHHTTGLRLPGTDGASPGAVTPTLLRVPPHRSLWPLLLPLAPRGPCPLRPPLCSMAVVSLSVPSALRSRPCSQWSLPLQHPCPVTLG